MGDARQQGAARSSRDQRHWLRHRSPRSKPRETDAYSTKPRRPGMGLRHRTGGPCLRMAVRSRFTPRLAAERWLAWCSPPSRPTSATRRSRRPRPQRRVLVVDDDPLVSARSRASARDLEVAAARNGREASTWSVPVASLLTRCSATLSCPSLRQVESTRCSRTTTLSFREAHRVPHGRAFTGRAQTFLESVGPTPPREAGGPEGGPRAAHADEQVTPQRAHQREVARLTATGVGRARRQKQKSGSASARGKAPTRCR